MPFVALNAYPSTVAGEGSPSSLKLQDTAPAANSTTTANFATTTTRRKIAWRPGVAGNTVAATPGAATGLGYNILKTEMNRTVDLPSKALIQAGVWDFNVAFTTAQADATGAAAKVEAWVYKRSAAGTFTLLFSSALPTGVSVLTAGAKTATWSSASQPAFTFESDETLHVELWVDAQGVVVVGNIYTLNLGANTWVNFPLVASQTVGIVDHHPRSYAAAAVGVATRQTNWIRLAAKTAVAAGIAPVPSKWVRLATKVATAIGLTPPPAKYSRLATKSATAIGVATLQPRWVRLAAKTATAIGVATRQANWIRLAAKTVISVGVPAYTRRNEAFRSFAATGIGFPSYTRAVIAVRSFLATAVGVTSVPVKYVRLAAKSATAVGLAVAPVKWVRLAAKTATAVGVAVAPVKYVRLAAKSATAIGSPTMVRAVIAVRSFLAAAIGVASGRIEMGLDAYDRATRAEAPPASPTKAVAGVVRDSEGLPVSGATVKLFRQSDDRLIASTTSAANGAYSFARDTTDNATYYVLAYEMVGTETHGVTDRSLIPA